MTVPAGTVKRSTRRVKPGGRAVLRLEGEEEPGDADGQRVHDGQMAREEGIGLCPHDDGRGQEGGVHGLGDEEVGDPLDVGDHLPALRQDPRHGGERAVEEHYAGNGSARLAPRPHRDPEVRLLERLHVVDPVPDHRHHVPLGLEDVHDGELLLRSDPAEQVGRIER